MRDQTEVGDLSISGNWDRRVSRRTFLGLGGMSAAALMLGTRGVLSQTSGSAGYGELVPDPGGLIDLPRGFQYRVISEEGSLLSRGGEVQGVVPGDHDGMAAFRGPSGGTAVLVRNHEQKDGDPNPLVGSNPYDPAAPGGTTGIVVNLEDRTEIGDYVTSSGTFNNCAGGATPWGTWPTCEEDRTAGHGYVFEVDPNDPENELSRTPIRGMGFFSHEAVDIDPSTGIAYLTEDDFRGSITDDPKDEIVADVPDTEGGRGTRVSFLYRYIPNDRGQRPGALQQGGRLQVMTLNKRRDYNADLAFPGDRFQVVWKDVNPEEPHESAEDLKAARFNRLEGAYFAGGAFWFDDTLGGEARLGQIFRYLPGSNTLELFYEGTEPGKMESPDNIVVTLWGELWFAEDETIDGGDTINRVMGITADGQVYPFASNRLNDSEFARPTFAPDGKTFFVNFQNPGLTFAIWGPFGQRDTKRQTQMAVAAPPESMTPEVSGELAEAAARYGMSPLEAAAYDRLGVSLA